MKLDPVTQVDGNEGRGDGADFVRGDCLEDSVDPEGESAEGIQVI